METYLKNKSEPSRTNHGLSFVLMKLADMYEEEIGAYVQPQDDISLSEREVIDYCRNVFPFAKCPKVVIFGDDILVTLTGKYQRNKLRPLFEKWKGVQLTEGQPR